MERGFVLRELLKQAITLAIFYFVMKHVWGTEQWFNDKVKELFFFLSIGLIYFIASLAALIVSRPVVITITQINKRFNQTSTTFSIKGRTRTQDHERTVSVQITVLRKQSIWGLVCSKILSRYQPTILIEPATPGIIVQKDTAGTRVDLAETPTGLIVNLSNYLSSIINNSPSGTFNKVIDYKISDQPSNPVTDETIYIVPQLMCRGQKAPYWLTSLIRFDNSHCEHVVHFKRG
ncbi:MAG: hypothetical protein J7639_18795 [Paenibacillaceae bacterium]|nr:hypothetical protein [Paenibacillaceae bacterium]